MLCHEPSSPLLTTDLSILALPTGHTQIQLNTTVYFFKCETGTNQGLFSKNISLPTKKLAPVHSLRLPSAEMNSVSTCGK